MATSSKNKVIIAVTLLLLLIIVAPFAYFFYDAGRDTGEPFFWGLFFVIVVAFFLAVAMIVFVFSGNKEDSTDKSNVQASTGPSPSEILTAITVGTALGGRSSRKKRKSITESAQDDLRWQEKYRKDRYYDDEEDL